MDAQKEALRRIIITLTNKNQELKDFLRTLEWTRTGLQEESCRVMSELEEELEQLSSALEERGTELRAAIVQSQQRKEAELQAQQGEGQSALASSEELLTFANSALLISNDARFLQAAKEIKERVTMASAFRITTRPLTSPDMSQFAVDFSAERAGLHRLDFLPVPSAPRLDVCRCFVRDNSVFLQWSAVDQSGASYELQYRKCDSEATPPAAEACWEKIQGIRDTHSAISGLRFDSRFLEVRVRARNKSAAGEFSETLLLETPGFDFGLDSDSAHPELTVERHSATWGSKGKGHDPRSKTKTSSRCGAGLSVGRCLRLNPRLAEGRGSVLRESRTLSWELSGGGHYWEVRPMGDWKCVSVGVAYRGALSRFVRLGKSPASWSLSLSQWLQPSVSAKHNNKSKNLHPSVPARVGVYCHYGNGDLLFIDVEQMRLIHSFRTKFNQSLVPAFSVWCGGIAVETGLQVPSFIHHILLPSAPPTSALPTSAPPTSAPPTSAPPTSAPPPPEVQLSPSDPGPDRGPGSDLETL